MNPAPLPSLATAPTQCHHKLRIDFLVSPEASPTSQAPRLPARATDVVATGRRSKTNSAVGTKRTWRSGGWTDAEMDYTLRLSADFKDGLLPDATAGILLRQYLSAKLNCSPMRLSKKFDKSSGILGMHRYDPTASVLSGLTPEMRRLRKKELKQLEEAFLKQCNNVTASDEDEPPTIMPTESRSAKRRRLPKVHSNVGAPSPCTTMAPLDMLVALACHVA